MLITVEGQFKDGQIVLTESPAGVDQAKVIVTFLPPAGKGHKPAHIHFGMFKGDGVTQPEDFRLAEWRGEPGDTNGGNIRP
jgi:hypothetical protein